jgi:hypothetical protein
MGCGWLVILIIAVFIGYCMILEENRKMALEHAIAIDTYQKVEIAKALRREELRFQEEQGKAAAAKAVADLGSFFNSVGQAFGELSENIFAPDQREKEVQTRW